MKWATPDNGAWEIVRSSEDLWYIPAYRPTEAFGPYTEVAT